MKDYTVADAMRDTLISPNVLDRNMEPANIVDALDYAGTNLGHISASLDRLGVNGANTGCGAIELLAREIRDGAQAIANAIMALADAVESSKR